MERTAAAYGVYPDLINVTEVVGALNLAGFDNEDICLMLAPANPIATQVRDAKMLSAEREASANPNRVISWLAEFGAVVIPSLGFFIRSQAFLHALLVARDAPALCGNFRTLSGLGFPEPDAKRLEAHLQHAGFLVYVAAGDLAELHWALELIRGTGAQESAVLDKEMTLEATA